VRLKSFDDFVFEDGSFSFSKVGSTDGVYGKINDPNGASSEVERTNSKRSKVKPKKEVDEEIEKKIQKHLGDKNDACPRCGEPLRHCKCQEKDFYSTRNMHRIPAGKTIKTEEK
jgi:hypothetical protein